MSINNGGNGATVAPLFPPNRTRHYLSMNPNKLLGTILAGVAVVAYVTLALLDEGTGNVQNFVLFATPFITMLLVKDKLDDIKATGKTIEHQTNGIMSTKIKTAVSEAINELTATNESESNNG